MSVERSPRPGVTWESLLRPGGEVVVECEQDDVQSPFGWSEDDEALYGPQGASPASGDPWGANRATRRAQARAARRKGAQR